MYHVYNVVKYLTNDPFCIMDSLLDDVERAYVDYKTLAPNDATVKLHTAFYQYLQQKFNEVVNFANILMMSGYPLEYKDLMLYYNMPFRSARNPMVDKRIIELMLGIDDLRIDQFIMGILGDYERDRFNGNSKFLDELYYFFYDQRISFESIGHSQKIGWMSEKIPYDPNQIITNYNNAMANKNSTIDCKAIGDFGEYLFYQYLLNNSKETDQNLWISRDLGDGFGYDLAKYDSSINMIKLYEVKTTTRPDKFYNVDLSEFESRICNNYKNLTDTEYHVIRVLVGDNTQMIDINDKTEEIKDLYQNAPSKILLRTRATNNNYLIQKN
ncbi:MAG: DUF3883 domain-containing protein [Bacilli bacterium]|nr:DUF3883 domain-containing protein [Bacilli bacterium]